MPFFKSKADAPSMSSPLSSKSNNQQKPRRRSSQGWFASHLPLLSHPRSEVPSQTYEQIQARLKRYKSTNVTSSSSTAPVGFAYLPVASFRRDEILTGAKIPLESPSQSDSKSKKSYTDSHKKKTRFEYFDVSGIRILDSVMDSPDNVELSMNQSDGLNSISLTPHLQVEGVAEVTIDEEARYKIATQALQVVRQNQSVTTDSKNYSNDRHEEPPIHKYMIKQVHHDCWNDDQDWFLTITHLVRETDLLKRLSHQHENLLTLRGTTLEEKEVFLNATTSTTSQWDSYFSMTDRISETLAQRIDRWREENKDNPTEVTFDKDHPHPLLETKLLSPIHPKTTPTAHCPVVVGGDEQALTNPVFRTRLLYAQNLASVLAFLHSKQIIVRNLHPEAIGFSAVDDTIQLMDLGQALQVGDDNHSTATHGGRNTSTMNPTAMLQQQHKEALFQMTPGNTLRYMAPELLTSPVPHNKHCGYAVDSYSWSMVCFEMFTLSEPYATLKPGQHLHHVCLMEEAGSSPVRPHLQIFHFPKRLKHLLKGAWHQDTKRRYRMTDIDYRLQKMLSGAGRENEKGIRPKKEELLEDISNEKTSSVSGQEDEMDISFPRHRHQLATSA